MSQSNPAAGRRSMAGLTAEQLMNSPAVTVKASDTVRQAIEILIDNKISGAPLISNHGTLLSMVTEADLMKFAALYGLENPVQDYIEKLAVSDKLITVQKEALFPKIFEQFIKNPIRRIPVIDMTGKLQGVISRRDIIKAFLEQQKETETPKV